MSVPLNSSDEQIDALDRARRRGVPVGSIIDVGASDGRWAEVARYLWPSAPILMLEANEAHEPALQAFTQRFGPAGYVLGVAGPSSGSAAFVLSEDRFGGTVISAEAAKSVAADRVQRLEQVSIDDVVTQLKLPPPYVIKLDTHGYETEILKGAARTLKDTTLLQVEVYNFRLRPDVLVFAEMCFHLDQLGYRLADVFDVIRRPSDGLMWQADALFESKAAPWWKNGIYR